MLGTLFFSTFFSFFWCRRPGCSSGAHWPALLLSGWHHLRLLPSGCAEGLAAVAGARWSCSSDARPALW